MTPSLQFIRALVRGARLYHRLGVPLLDAGMGAVRSFFLPVRRRVHPDVAAARMRACEGCQFYEPGLRTCGDGVSVLEAPDGSPVPAGCQCWLPLKTTLPDAVCFLADIGLDSRWEPHDRPRPEHPDSVSTP